MVVRCLAQRQCPGVDVTGDNRQDAIQHGGRRRCRRPSNTAASGRLAFRAVAGRTANDPILNALAHPVRTMILRRGADGLISPKEVAEAMGEPLGNVSYHVRILAEAGLLKLSKTEPRRGALAHYYVVPPSAKKAIRRANSEIAELADAL